jgi:hypothetical protein
MLRLTRVNHIVVDTVVVHEFVVAAIVVVLKPNLINLAVFFSNDAEAITGNTIVVDLVVIVVVEVFVFVVVAVGFFCCYCSYCCCF